MIGAIIGDIVGSVYEFSDEKPILDKLIVDDSNFTDDSVMTIAISDALLKMKHSGGFSNAKIFYIDSLQNYGRAYPNVGYGMRFYDWIFEDTPNPYGSYGNGSAMRVSPVGYAFSTMEETMRHAEISSSISHNHPDGIAGAKALAGAVFLARKGRSKQEIKQFVENEIGYSLNFNLESLHNDYLFEVQCKFSVPQAIYAFLVSDNFKDAICKSIYIGGDSDTIACMAGAIAEAYYHDIPEYLIEATLEKLDDSLSQTIIEFYSKFNVSSIL